MIKKKFISAVLTCALIISLMPGMTITASASLPVMPLPDIEITSLTEHNGRVTILWSLSNNPFEGTPEGYFIQYSERPNGPFRSLAHLDKPTSWAFHRYTTDETFDMTKPHYFKVSLYKWRSTQGPVVTRVEHIGSKDSEVVSIGGSGEDGEDSAPSGFGVDFESFSFRLPGGSWQDITQWTEVRAGAEYSATFAIPANAAYPQSISIAYDASWAEVSTVGGELPPSFTRAQPMSIQLSDSGSSFTLTLTDGSSSARYIVYASSPGTASATPPPATPPPATAPPTQEIKVLVNGAAVTFDQPPIIENGRTLVPLRAIFEALGATVEWEQSTQTVTAVKDDITIILKIGDVFLTKNGERITLDVPAKIVGGRTLVPARAVAESFGAEVGWDQATRTVTITD